MKSLSIRLLFVLFISVHAFSGVSWAEINQWSNIGPAGTNANAFAFDPNPAYHNDLYAATDAGLYRSSAGGKWESAQPYGINTGKVYAVAIQNGSPMSTIYIASENGFFKSTDRGASFVDTGMVNIKVVALDPSSPSTVYAAGPAGVYRSTGGAWSQIYTVPAQHPAVTSIAVNPQNPSIIYIGTDGDGIFKSADGGTTWGSIVGNTRIAAIAISGSNPSTIFAVTFHPIVLYPHLIWPYFDIQKSTDAGGTWSSKFHGEMVTASSIIIDPSNTSIIYAGTGSGVYKSADSGESWNLATTGLTSIETVALAIDTTSDNRLAAATSGGIFLSTDGAVTWNAANSGLANKAVSALAAYPADKGTIYEGSTDVISKSTNIGDTWSKLSHGCSALAMDPKTPSTLYIGDGGSVYKSTDNGSSWGTAGSGLPASVTVNTLAIDPKSTSTIYAGLTGGIYKSTDGGSVWSSAGTALAGFSVISIAINPENTNILFAGTSLHGGYKSWDGGATWTHVISVPGVSNLIFDPGNSSIIFASTHPGMCEIDCSYSLAKSTDGGDNWDTNFGSLSVQIEALAFDPANPAMLYAGVDGGVLKSSDGGGTWEQVVGGEQVSNVSSLAFDGANPSTLYAGTFNSGVFKITLVPDASVIGDAVDNTALTWTTGGDANWFGQQSVFMNDHDAARSGAIGPSQTSWVQTSIPYVSLPGTLKFYWKVSSEYLHDYLTVSFNGFNNSSISGNVDWAQKTFNIAKPFLRGSPVNIKWAFTNDANNTAGADAAWLDKVEYIPAPILNLTIAGTGSGTVTSDPSGINANTSTAVPFFIDSTVTLSASPAEFSLFSPQTDWNGCDSQTAPGGCQVAMTSARSITATFNKDLAHMVWLGGNSYSSTLQAAYDAAPTPGPSTIKAWGTEFENQDLNCNVEKSVTLDCGYNQAYDKNVGTYTTLHGHLTVGKGALTVANLIIE